MLFALHSKPEPIAKCIAIFIQAFFPMEILQCDNGKEFKGALLILLRQYGIKIVHGAPRTSHVQGHWHYPLLRHARPSLSGPRRVIGSRIQSAVLHKR